MSDLARCPKCGSTSLVELGYIAFRQRVDDRPLDGFGGDYQSFDTGDDHFVTDYECDDCSWGSKLSVEAVRANQALAALNQEHEVRLLSQCQYKEADEKEYLVSWQIEVDGKDPRDAAEAALESIRRLGSEALVFVVSDEDKTQTIDLNAVEEGVQQ